MFGWLIQFEDGSYIMPRTKRKVSEGRGEAVEVGAKREDQKRGRESIDWVIELRIKREGYQGTREVVYRLIKTKSKRKTKEALWEHIH